METIIFKVPDGTKAKLRAVNRNISALLREQTEKVITGKKGFVSAHEKAKHLIVHERGARHASTSKDYLKQYAQKNHR